VVVRDQCGAPRTDDAEFEPNLWVLDVGIPFLRSDKQKCCLYQKRDTLHMWGLELTFCCTCSPLLIWRAYA
jgi:hypothetical protein